MRRLALIVTACAIAVLSGLAVVAWVYVPRWFPHWTVKHSPWVEPALRATAYAAENACWKVFLDRLAKWPSDPVPPLVASLGSKDRNIRMSAAIALMERGNPTAESALICIARSDKDNRVREWALMALGSIGGAESIRLCESLKSDPHVGKIADSIGLKISDRVPSVVRPASGDSNE